MSSQCRFLHYTILCICELYLSCKLTVSSSRNNTNSPLGPTDNKHEIYIGA